MRLQTFHALDDIKNIEDGVYYQPDFRSLSAVDAISSQFAFQFTCASKHDLSRQGLLDVMAKFSQISCLVFFLPPDRFSLFGRQRVMTTSQAEARDKSHASELRQIAAVLDFES